MSNQKSFPLHINNARPGKNTLMILTVEYAKNEVGDLVPSIKHTIIKSSMEGIAHCPKNDGFLIMANESEGTTLLAGMQEALKFLNDPRAQKKKTLTKQLAVFFADKVKKYYS